MDEMANLYQLKLFFTSIQTSFRIKQCTKLVLFHDERCQRKVRPKVTYLFYYINFCHLFSFFLRGIINLFAYTSQPIRYKISCKISMSALHYGSFMKMSRTVPVSAISLYKTDQSQIEVQKLKLVGLPAEASFS